MTDEQFGGDLIVAVAWIPLLGWLDASWSWCMDHPGTSIVSAVAGVLVALIGAWVEAARQSLRERVARIEGRVEALEKSR